jgi:hypothetical protein
MNVTAPARTRRSQDRSNPRLERKEMFVYEWGVEARAAGGPCISGRHTLYWRRVLPGASPRREHVFPFMTAHRRRNVQAQLGGIALSVVLFFVPQTGASALCQQNL